MMFIIFKPGPVVHLSLLFQCKFTFFECLCSLLRRLGRNGRTQPLFYDYIAGLCLSYYSSSGSLNQGSLSLVITITSLLKRLRIATFSVAVVTSDTS